MDARILSASEAEGHRPPVPVQVLIPPDEFPLRTTNRDPGVQAGVRAQVPGGTMPGHQSCRVSPLVSHSYQKTHLQTIYNHTLAKTKDLKCPVFTLLQKT